jgi:hypothetical protein
MEIGRRFHSYSERERDERTLFKAESKALR